MKIGILTQPLHRNYGGIIQNWALQQVLRRMGHEPEMIHRCYNAPTRTPQVLARRCMSLGKWAIKKALGRCPEGVRLCSPFVRQYDLSGPRYADKCFIRQSINQSPELYSHAEFDRWMKRAQYDAFVVGSDQVWREEYSPEIETYFLDFLGITEVDRRPRVAYAASFGTDSNYISKEHLPQCIKGLQTRFTAVSVREDGGLRIARDVFGRKDAVKVLDPTLLLTAEDYRAIITDTNRQTAAQSAPYIAAYILDDSDDKRHILDDISARTGLQIKRMTAGCDTAGRMHTVSQWLAAFDGATAVVTDSFHGSVFSLIFGRRFLAIGNADRGLDRFTSLLGSMDLTDRLVLSLADYRALPSEFFAEFTTGHPFPTAEVTDRLAALRTASLDFLKKALDNGSDTKK